MNESLTDVPEEELVEKEKLVNYIFDSETNEIIEVENIHQVSMLNENNLGTTFALGLVLLMVVAVLKAAYSLPKIGD